MELGIIRQINIDSEMQAAYLDYAMSVIVSRALPDVRDGFKPVHRRILYAMHDLGLTYDKPYKKSARIVGEVLGKYHPHGDAAVYEAMVRMAQDFSLRDPLVDGQGNFGSIDSDNAAAMRYTEARLSAIAHEMLADIEKETVAWTDNFDGTLKEPAVLPAALPNLLVNGSSGIAVGMATNIPPHNLGEVCDALSYLIDHYDHHEAVTVEDLMRFIPGPDFPTGGVVYRYAKEPSVKSAEAAPTPPGVGTGAADQVDAIAHAYAGGKGSIVMQAKAHIEEMSRSKNRIVVTELPYQTNKTNLLERIADLVRDGRLEGITDLRDESDRTGMRICIELTRTVDPRQVLADLFKLTPLQQTFGVSLLALVADENGRLEPRLLSLKRLLMHYIEHRQEVIVRRSKYDLERARQRAHILEGLLRALDVLDEVIALIRGSKTADVARQGLIQKFSFTELQAQAILDMQLRRLAALERQKLKEEYKQIQALIKELEALLKSPKKVLARIQDDLADLKARYADPRRTQIADRVQGILTTHDLLPDEEVWITLASDGILARHPAAAISSTYPFPSAAQLPPLRANTRDDLYLFSAKGQVTRVSVHQIPEAGSHFAELSGFGRRDRVVAICALPKPEGETPASSFQLLGTVQGKVKRVALADPSTGSPQKTRDFAGQGLLDQAATNPQVIGLDEGDELLWAGVSQGGGEVLLITAQGQAIRFPEDDVRAMGLPAGGVAGIKLAAKDRVVAGMALGAQGSSGAGEQGSLALVTTACYAKRVPLADFPAQGRGGQGVIALKMTPRIGELAAAGLCSPRAQLIFRMAGGKTRVVNAADVPEQSRSAQGKFLAELAVGTPVEGMVVVAVEPEEMTQELGGTQGRTKELGGTQGKTKELGGTQGRAPTAEQAAKPARGKAKTETEKAAPAVGAIPPRSPSPEPTAKPARGKTKPETQPAPAAGAIPPRSPAVEPSAKPARGKTKAETQPAPPVGAIPPRSPVAEPAARPARGKVKGEAQPTLFTEPESKAARSGEVKIVPPPTAPPKPVRGKAMPAPPPAAEPAAKPAPGRGKAQDDVKSEGTIKARVTAKDKTG